MQYEGLRIAKSILFKIFWIGYLILIAAWLIYIGLKPQLFGLFFATWHATSPEFVDMVTLGFFALGKFVLIFYALVPAIAIHLTLRKLEKKAG